MSLENPVTTTDLGAALLLGLAGSGHCLGMCGGIAIALRPDPDAHRLLPVAYHLGRIISYALLGALIGGAAGAIQLAAWTIGLRFMAGALLIGMGLHMLDIWRGIDRLERLGGQLWRRVVPLTRTLMPPRHLAQGLALGGLWGFMPCGLIYSALGWSAASGGSATGSGLLMLLFGLGTVPAMLGTTLLGQRAEKLLRDHRLKTVIGISLVLAGTWTLVHTATRMGPMLAGGHMGSH